jgi:hypothetical protein
MNAEEAARWKTKVRSIQNTATNLGLNYKIDRVYMHLADLWHAGRKHGEWAASQEQTPDSRK